MVEVSMNQTDWSNLLMAYPYAEPFVQDWRSADRSGDPHWPGYEEALNLYMASREDKRCLVDRYASLNESRQRFQRLRSKGDGHLATRLALIRTHLDLGEREAAANECQRLLEKMSWLQEDLSADHQIEIDRPFLVLLSDDERDRIDGGLAKWLRAALRKVLERCGNFATAGQPRLVLKQPSSADAKQPLLSLASTLSLTSVPLLDASSTESYRQNAPGDTKSSGQMVSAAQKAAAASDPPIFYIAHAALQYMQPPLYSKRQVFCGPSCITQRDAQGYIQTLQSPVGYYSVPKLLEALPPDQQPAILIAHVDATMRNLPMNLADMKCLKIMLIGDTHHLKQPLQNVGQYLRESRFDLYLADCKKHHLHFFYEDQPDKLFFFFPGFRNRFEAPIFLGNKQRLVTFIGQTGKFHPLRTKILEQVKSKGFPLLIQSASQEQSAAIYAHSLISINISLNAELNMRFFEVLAAGGFLLTDRISSYTGYDMVFQEGRDFVFFENADDLCEKIDHYLKHPEQALKIARNGFKTYHRHWNIAARRRKFLNLVMANQVDPILAAFQDMRFPIGKATDRTFLEERIRHYEFLQDQHRYGPLQVFLTPCVPSEHRLDLQDLARLEIVSDAIDASCEQQKIGSRIGLCSIEDLRHSGTHAWCERRGFDYLLVTRDARQNLPLDFKLISAQLGRMNLEQPFQDYPGVLRIRPGHASKKFSEFKSRKT